MKKYENLEKAELLKIIDQLESRKKYGLVWDEETTKEKLDEKLTKAYPILKEVKTKHIKNSEQDLNHILIEADNAHALTVLNYTHQEKIDVIYIDPPYNTGNKSWKYNNDYVERDDTFKHSKWLTFMSRRLKLAKPLLTDRGVIVVAIDDYEIHTLRLLMDEIFGENNRLGTITVVHNPRGRNDDKFFATSHEYLLVYAKNSEKASVGYFELTEDDIDSYKKSDGISAFSEASFIRTGNNSTRESRPNLFYSIYFNPDTEKLSLEKSKGSIELLPINEANEEKTWRWGKDTFSAKCDTELLVRVVKGKHRIFKKRRLTDSKGKKPKTVWVDSRYDASSNGIILLQNIFGTKDVFPYPKSLYAVEDMLELLSHKDSTVLDFFAGSGTTGHAVLDLNKRDGGSRKFILCTSDEGKICSEVCYPRISKVINGYTNLKNQKVEGYKGNLRFFKEGFVSKTLSPDDLRLKITSHCTELLCIRESIFEEVLTENEYSIFKQNKKFLGIFYSLDTRNLKKLKKHFDKLDGEKILYCFTLSTLGVDPDEFSDWGNVTLKEIPEKIIKIYDQVSQY